MSKYFVAIDIENKISVSFKKNIIVKKKKFKTSKFGPLNLTKVRNYLLINNKDIAAIGIATTGLIHKKKWSTLNRNMIGSFDKFPIINFFKIKFNTPIFAIGDTHAASLGELYYGYL